MRNNGVKLFEIFFDLEVIFNRGTLRFIQHNSTAFPLPLNPNLSLLPQDTLDFIAYVAKDSRYGRACFVLECGGGLAQDVITTIGQAFELRFKEYLKRTPSVHYTSVKSDK